MHSPCRRPWRSTGKASSTSGPTARYCCRRRRGPRQASTHGRARNVWWQGVCCHSGQKGETLKFSPSAQTLYTTSSVISDYTTEPGALGYIVLVDLQLSATFLVSRPRKPSNCLVPRVVRWFSCSYREFGQHRSVNVDQGSAENRTITPWWCSKGTGLTFSLSSMSVGFSVQRLLIWKVSQPKKVGHEG